MSCDAARRVVKPVRERMDNKYMSWGKSEWSEGVTQSGV